MPEPDKRIKYEFPFFLNNEGLQKTIDFSFEYLRKRFGSVLTLGRLILTAHSGGGVPVSTILRLSLDGTLELKKSPKEIDEVHLFDSTYEAQGNTVKWANKKIAADAKLSAADMPTKGGALRVIFPPVYESCAENGTAAGSREIQIGIKDKIAANPGLDSWYRVEPTRISHSWIPKTFGFQLLAAANAILDDSYGKDHINACCAKTPAKCEAPKATQKSLGLDYEEPDYFAEREASYTNY